MPKQPHLRHAHQRVRQSVLQGVVRLFIASLLGFFLAPIGAWAHPLEEVYLRASQASNPSRAVISSGAMRDAARGQGELKAKVDARVAEESRDSGPSSIQQQSDAAAHCAPNCYSIKQRDRSSLWVTCQAGSRRGEEEILWNWSPGCYSLGSMGGCMKLDRAALLVCNLQK